MHILAVIFVLLLGNHIIVIGLAAIIVIILNLKLKLGEHDRTITRHTDLDHGNNERGCDFNSPEFALPRS